MERGGGELAGKRAKASVDDDGAGGEDRLSALPDDILVLILLRLNTKEAARTSALSRRWRPVWTLRPKLYFFVRSSHSHFLRSVLSAGKVPLRNLFVGNKDASPQSLASWLPAAARRVSGELRLISFVSGERAPDGEAEAERCIELPCFEKATLIMIRIDLGFLGISVAPTGVFARLTKLSLSGFKFHGPGELGDAVSTPRCPCLHNVRGLDSININSESLQLLDLENLRDVRRLTVGAPRLDDLSMVHCFIIDQNHPVINISAPQLRFLKRVDAYDQSSVHLGSMEHLQMMHTFLFVYGPDDFPHNRACLTLLPQFKAIEYLVLSMALNYKA